MKHPTDGQRESALGGDSRGPLVLQMEGLVEEAQQGVSGAARGLSLPPGLAHRVASTPLLPHKQQMSSCLSMFLVHSNMSSIQTALSASTLAFHKWHRKSVCVMKYKYLKKVQMLNVKLHLCDSLWCAKAYMKSLTFKGVGRNHKDAFRVCALWKK